METKVVDLKDLLKFADQCPDITPDESLDNSAIANCGCGGNPITEWQAEMRGAVLCKKCGIRAKNFAIWNRAMGVKPKRKVLCDMTTGYPCYVFDLWIDLGKGAFMSPTGNVYGNLEWRDE